MAVYYFQRETNLCGSEHPEILCQLLHTRQRATLLNYSVFPYTGLIQDQFVLKFVANKLCLNLLANSKSWEKPALHQSGINVGTFDFCI